MYFPYVRGKQYELLALRELIKNDKIGNSIIPIIEPIKPSSTLITTLESFIEKERFVIVISNPIVGNFIKELNKDENSKVKEKYIQILGNEYIYYGIDFDNSANIIDFEIPYPSKVVGIVTNSDSADSHSKILKEEAIFNVIKDTKEISRKIRNNKVMLEDKFNMQKRNADYLEVPDEAFSSDHRYFTEEGYLGFSDYSVIGSDYAEGGFAPYAVAIHIVYFSENEDLRIKHFTSDSNEDYNDPAGKFYEALQKLVDCDELTDVQTEGLDEFRKCYREERYPGLGSVKKMALKHHIELMSQYFNMEAQNDLL
jgi:hypothetical protein